MNITINNISNYLIILLLILLPFSVALVNIILYLIVFLVGITLYINKNKIYINTPLILYSILLIYSALNFIIQGSFIDNNKFWRFFPILFLGILSIAQLKNININRLEKISIISSLLLTFYTLFKTIIFYHHNNYLPFGSGEQIESVLIIHRPYLGFYILINIFLAFNLYIKENKYTYIFIIILLSSFLILILARLSILTLFITFLIYSFFYNKTNLKIKLVTIFIVVTSIFLLISLNPYTKERFKTDSFEKFVDYEPRFVIWKSVINISKDNNFNQIIGYGNKEIVDSVLVENYKKEISSESKKQYYVNEKFNTHSQFFDFYLMGGIPLVLLFVIFLICLLIYFKKDYLSTLITISFILFFSVENIFARQFGCFIFIIYIGFCILRTKRLSKN